LNCDIVEEKEKAMETIIVELQVLIECLKKKETALQQIVNITENQGFILTSDMSHEERYPIFMQMNDERQTLIDLVVQCDQVFESVLQKVGPALDADTTQYGDEVQAMQDTIRRIMDLDVKIRLEEQKNHQVLVNALPKGVVPPGVPQEGPPTSKLQVISGGKHADDQVRKAYESQSRHFKG